MLMYERNIFPAVSEPITIRVIADERCSGRAVPPKPPRRARRARPTGIVGRMKTQPLPARFRQHDDADCPWSRGAIGVRKHV